jgi:hypothetical protein
MIITKAKTKKQAAEVWSTTGERNEIGLVGKEGSGGEVGQKGGQAPLEVVGDLVVEAAGRAGLPLGELLLQPIAGDLAQHLHTRTRPTHISGKHEQESPAESGGRRIGGGWIGRGSGRSEWEEVGLGFGTFRAGEEELVMGRAVGGRRSRRGKVQAEGE